jgi:hypothetical protein
VFRIHSPHPVVTAACAVLPCSSSVAQHSHPINEETVKPQNQPCGDQCTDVNKTLQDPRPLDPGIPYVNDASPAHASAEHASPARASEARLDNHTDESSMQKCIEVENVDVSVIDKVQHGPSVSGEKSSEAAQLIEKQHLEVAILDSGATCEQPSLYVVRREHTHIAQEDIAEKLDVGMVSGCDTLQNVSMLLEHVYIPLLLSELPQQNDLSDGGGVTSPSTEQTTETELLAAMQKFLAQIKVSSSHLTGNMQLTIPNIEIHNMDEKDDDLLQTLESSLHDWTLTLQKLKQAQAGKTAEIEGPLGEIYFWGERNNVLGGLYEQVNQPKVQRMIQYGPSCRHFPQRYVLNIWVLIHHQIAYLMMLSFLTLVCKIAHCRTAVTIH